MSATSQGLGDCVVRKASEAFTLVRRQHEQVCGACCYMLEESLCGIVCDSADAFDLDAQLQDIFLRAAFRQDPPTSEEWPDAGEILEALAPDRRVDVHHCQLSLHEAGELYGVGERRLVRDGEIGGMKNLVKWEHRCVDRRPVVSEPASATDESEPRDPVWPGYRTPPASLRERPAAGRSGLPRGQRGM